MISGVVKRARANKRTVLAIVLLAVVAGYIAISARAATSPDLNNDGTVNVLDLSTLLSQWNTAGTADLNADNTVNILDLSILLSGWGATVVAPTPGPTQQYIVDNATRTITINPLGDYTTNLRNLLTQLVTSANSTNQWTLRLMPGTYTLTDELDISNLDYVHITSVNQSQPAKVTKNSINVEYLIYCRYCSNVRISYLTFEGVTSVYDPNAIHWPDQGVYFGSSHDTRVDHSTFRNIGNAALRHNTMTNDPILGVNSYNHYIEDNTFEKVWQVTTTQDSGTTHGGSRDWWVQRNTFNQVYGSLKYCSRTAGAARGHILNNTFTNSYNGPIELCSTTDIEIRYNNFQNNVGLVVSSYTNDAAGAGFQWGDNITFSDNTINGSAQGVRFDYTPYPDGFQPVGHNLVVSGNTFNGITDTDTGRGTIRVVNGPMVGASILNNTLSIVNNNPWDFASGSSGIVIQGNTVNGASYNTP
jgi:hypothetical protein